MNFLDQDHVVLGRFKETTSVIHRMFIAILWEPLRRRDSQVPHRIIMRTEAPSCRVGLERRPRTVQSARGHRQPSR
jgi:hypothetical protein